VLIAMLVEIITAALLADVHNLQLQGAITDFSSAELIIRYVTMCFVVDPDPLVLPVSGIKRVEVVEKVGLPAARDQLLSVLHGAFRTRAQGYGYCNK
jgi:hypothetical protein